MATAAVANGALRGAWGWRGRNDALLSTITFVAVLLYNFVRCNWFGNVFKSNTECCGEISYAFRNNTGTGLQGKVILSLLDSVTNVYFLHQKTRKKQQLLTNKPCLLQLM